MPAAVLHGLPETRGEMSTLSPVQTSLLNQAAASAVACEHATKVPAELALAQWALESGWGAHQPGNNCFGIKAYAGCFGVQRLTTVEFARGTPMSVVADFATFPTLDACFQKHASLFIQTQTYAAAWARYLISHDLNTLIRQIAPVYATDPSYAEKLLRIISIPEVAASLAAVRKGA
jgi:flagellum-specific peptidoglycan hydrolase FlgJ